MPDIDYQKQQFTQANVLHAVPGLDVGRLQAWLTRGHITLAEHSPGSGRPRLWSALEVIQIAALWELTRMKIPIGFAAKIAGRIRELAAEMPRPPEVVIENGERVLHIIPDDDNPDNLFFGETTERMLGLAGRDAILAGLDTIYGSLPVVVMIRPDLLIIQVVARLTDILDEGDVQ